MKVLGATRLLLVLAAILGLGLLWRKAQRPPEAVCKNCHVILVLLDTLRADALPCYGYERNTAPNLCAFANDHLLFTKSFSQSSYTLHSTFSILTSLYPSSHRFLIALKTPDTLHPDIVTLPQVLQTQGYETIFVGPGNHSSLPLERGLGRGFDVIIPNDGHPVLEGWEPGYQRLRDNARRGKPTFLLLHTYAVHAPYLVDPETKRLFTDDAYPAIPLTEEAYREIPEEDKQAFERLLLGERDRFLFDRYTQRIDASDQRHITYLRALYDEAIFSLDEALGRWFARLARDGVFDDTVVVITSDHGEEFMEHGHLYHTQNIYDTATSVPLIMSVPMLRPQRVEGLVQGIDIFPTILGLVGFAPPAQLEGLDLTDLLLKRPQARRNAYVISELFGGVARSIRDARWKLYVNIRMEPTELYDYLADPLERQNVVTERPEVAARLSRALQDVLDRERPFPMLTSPFPQWVDPLKRSKLIQEGYF